MCFWDSRERTHRAQESQAHFATLENEDRGPRAEGDEPEWISRVGGVNYPVGFWVVAGTIGRNG